MNQLPTFQQCAQSSAYVSARAFSAFALTLTLGGLAACSSTSDLTKERIAHSSVVIQQTQQTVGQSEAGAVELQRANENFEAAQKAATRVDDKGAQRFAALAALHAELAVAQTQNAAAQRAAQEVSASTQALQKESDRNSPLAR